MHLIVAPPKTHCPPPLSPELTRASERTRTQQTDQQRAAERQLALLKGEVSGVGMAHQATQAELERVAADVYARLADLDSATAAAREGAERAEKAAAAAATAGAGAFFGPSSSSSSPSSSSPLRSPPRGVPPSPASSSLTAPQELVSLREGLVGAAMDIDDLQVRLAPLPPLPPLPLSPVSTIPSPPLAPP